MTNIIPFNNTIEGLFERALHGYQNKCSFFVANGVVVRPSRFGLWEVVLDDTILSEFYPQMTGFPDFLQSVVGEVERLKRTLSITVNATVS